MSFKADTEVVERDGVLCAEVSPAWEIWGPNGGYLAAIALRAAGLRAPGGHRPASISVQYLSRGLFGEARLTVDVLRSARAVACLAVELVQEGKRVLTAQVWTTNKPEGDGPAYDEYVMPDIPPPEELQRLAGNRHRFWTNFDARPRLHLKPGEPDPGGALLEQWVRYDGFEPTGDEFLAQGRALQMIDTLLWPAHWRRSAAELDYLAPSLDVTAWFHAPSGDADWLLVEARAGRAHGGLIHGLGRVWTRDGRLVATGGSNLLHMQQKQPS